MPYGAPRCVIQDIVTHHSFTTTRVAHRSHASQIEFTDKLGSKGRAAGSVEAIQDIEMFLHQLRSRERTEIKDEIIDSVDSISTDGHDNVAITRKRLCNVVVSLKTRDRLAPFVCTAIVVIDCRL